MWNGRSDITLRGMFLFHVLIFLYGSVVVILHFAAVPCSNGKVIVAFNVDIRFSMIIWLHPFSKKEGSTFHMKIKASLLWKKKVSYNHEKSIGTDVWQTFCWSYTVQYQRGVGSCNTSASKNHLYETAIFFHDHGGYFYRESDVISFMNSTIVMSATCIYMPRIVVQSRKYTKKIDSLWLLRVIWKVTYSIVGDWIPKYFRPFKTS